MSIGGDLYYQPIKIFRRMEESAPRLVPETRESDAAGIREAVPEGPRKSVIHLAGGDKGLLPMLVARHGETARRVALAFIEEWAFLASALNAYIAKWNMEKLIEGNRDVFR